MSEGVEVINDEGPAQEQKEASVKSPDSNDANEKITSKPTTSSSGKQKNPSKGLFLILISNSAIN